MLSDRSDFDDFLEVDEDDVEGILPLEIIGECKEYIRKRNKYSLVSSASTSEEEELVHWARDDHLDQRRAAQRNVLLCHIGGARPGKTTCVNVLKTPCHSVIGCDAAERKTPFVGPVEPETKVSFVMRDFVVRPPTTYSISVVDLPGDSGCLCKGDDPAQTRENLLAMLGTCHDVGVDHLHCILVFDTGLGLRVEDLVPAIVSLRDMFEKDKGVRIALVVTHCDDRLRSRMRLLSSYLRKDPECGPLLRDQEIEILFTGAVDSTFSETREELLGAYRKVYKMRARILRFIFGAESFAWLPAWADAWEEERFAFAMSRRRQESCMTQLCFHPAKTKTTPFLFAWKWVFSK